MTTRTALSSLITTGFRISALLTLSLCIPTSNAYAYLIQAACDVGTDATIFRNDTSVSCDTDRNYLFPDTAVINIKTSSSVDVTRGEMKLYASQQNTGSFASNVTGGRTAGASTIYQDDFEVSGFSADEVLLLRVELRVDGGLFGDYGGATRIVGRLDTVNRFNGDLRENRALGSFQWDSPNDRFAFVQSNQGNVSIDASLIPTNFLMSATAFVEVSAANPTFNARLSMQAIAAAPGFQSPATTISDFSNTGTLGIFLPEGYTATSSGGTLSFVGTPPTVAVPAPMSLLLVVPALAILARKRAR